ncbi:MAG TPA: DUF4760 domain-containing protein [Urbifossiella sp.]|nr:DUF4760 domain-containing protein [Urbifossiella sp.]
MSAETIATIGAVSNIATTVGVVIGLIGLVFVWLQIRQGVLARETSVCLMLAQYSNSQDFTQALMTVLGRGPAGPAATIDQEAALKVCVFFELVASIVNHDYMSPTLIREFYGSVIADAHDRLRGYIDEQREQTRRPKFCINFEKLAADLAHNPLPAAGPLNASGEPPPPLP